MSVSANPHPRDALIEFDAGPHKYTCAGEANYTSVTTWNHSHFKQFDADEIIDGTRWDQEITGTEPMITTLTISDQLNGQLVVGHDEAPAAQQSLTWVVPVAIVGLLLLGMAIKRK